MLLETLLSQDGKLQHLDYHEKRLHASYKELYGTHPPFTLHDVTPPLVRSRCRVVYDKQTLDVNYFNYTPIYKRHFAIVSTTIDYHLKYLDRDYFNTQQKLHTDVDDIIYLKNNLVTDTSIANIACFIDNQWLTPLHPLLKGTTRQRLLETKKLKEEPITLEMLKNADSIALMNALTGFYIVKEPIFKG